MTNEALASLNVAVSDELDRQVGLDSSTFAIFTRYGKEVVRVNSILPEKNFPFDSVSGRREWLETGEEIAKKLADLGFGEWYVNSVSGRHAELWQEDKGVK